MKIIVDSTTDMYTIETDQALKFIAELNDKFKTRGMLIERFEHDGKPVSFLSLHQNPELLRETRELKIFTKRIVEVIKDALEFSKFQLPKLIDSMQAICTLARQDKVSDALKSYASIMPFFKMLIMGLVSIADWGKKTQFDQTQLNASIHELNEALSKKDYVSFCDALEYKLIPELNTLDASLKNFSVE